MEGDTRRRLLQEREQERKRQELRQAAERAEQEQQERRTDALRDRLRDEREATRRQAQRFRQERDEEQTRLASRREAARELANQRRAEREVELKRVQLDREVRRRAADGGDRSHLDEAYKSALEYDIYVRNRVDAHTERDHAEHVSRQVGAGSARVAKVSDPDVLLHHVEQLRASVALSTERPNERAWFAVGAICFLVLVTLYLVL